MNYISAGNWRDLTDGHLYHEGEPFPFDGREIPAERLEELENGQNRAGLRLIRAAEIKNDAVEVQKEEAPKTAAVGRKTATAKTAKATKTKNTK